MSSLRAARDLAVGGRLIHSLARKCLGVFMQLISDISLYDLRGGDFYGEFYGSSKVKSSCGRRNSV